MDWKFLAVGTVRSLSPHAFVVAIHNASMLLPSLVVIPSFVPSFVQYDDARDILLPRRHHGIFRYPNLTGRRYSRGLWKWSGIRSWTRPGLSRVGNPNGIVVEWNRRMSGYFGRPMGRPYPSLVG